MKLFISTTTTNRQFVKALRRQHSNTEILNTEIEKLSINNCECEILLLAFVDRDQSYSRVIAGEVDIFEFEVGYDFQHQFLPDDDVLVVQLLEEKILQMIAACSLHATAKEALRHVVVNWTTDVIKP
jgi:uncharacterized protein (DUF342 family)